MSYREDHFLKFQPDKTSEWPDYTTGQSPEKDRELFLRMLQKGIHGFCYSIYEEGQKPGDIISESQIRKRMQILKTHTRWIRSFSCIEGNQFIPVIAREMGLKTLVGAWLGDDREKNEMEIDNLIRLAREGFVDIAAVGNEVLYRGDLSEGELLEYIDRVKKAIPGVPVGYVDAYYEFSARPALSSVCDVILSNCYPFWEGTPLEYSMEHVIHMYEQAYRAGNGKQVIITETGWPTAGGAFGGAIPSEENAVSYFINIHSWAQERGVDVFHFSSFDESWKVGAEGDLGAHWGIWDKSEKLKF